MMSSVFRALWSRGQNPARRLVDPVRGISISSVMSDKPAVPTEPSSQSSVLSGATDHKVDNMEKRFLVWSGKYKRIEDVPPKVSQGTMERARNKVRIKIANYLMLATVLACIGFVYSGKQAAKRGESVHQMNIDWHKQMDSEVEKQKAGN